ncbi:MAG: T9SS type A sorting domain-containing protein [Bacteroidetes bacterium]|nr:T9SS type A sorting domain-containing protein [Bacteroidota bacterium]
MNDVMCGSTSANSDLTNKTEIKLYPNPAFQTVSFYSAVEDNYHIFNLLGENIKNGIVLSGENKIDLTGIESGTYILRIGKRNAMLIIERK